MSATTTREDRGGTRTLPGGTTTPRAVPILRCTADFTVTQGFVCTQTGIRMLHHHILMHQADVDLIFENLGWQINFLCFRASHIQYWNFHVHYSEWLNATSRIA